MAVPAHRKKKWHRLFPESVFSLGLPENVKVFVVAGLVENG
jgi:hypothetical protein